ncbi:MAG TPA: MlaD family protein [Baekduia sp.]|uniref:MlaD family protein n=1 Tax=Baekduia sp. TaxID=2600305 RepID=UPI002C862E0B|nr:MlaD family protein [Baekduia sp.]HMJ37631.1 MlaD family protein [Baekduia sp.]
MYIPAIPSAARHPYRAPRRLALAALVLVAAALAWVLLRDPPHRYRVVFQNAGQLVKGDVVRIGGTPVGTVKSVDLSDDDQAQVDVTVSGDYGPLHEGTTATIRAEGLTGVASRYVDLSPASQTRPKLDDGGLIRSDKTTSIVEIDQLFNTLEPKTRKGLQGFIQGSADWYAGREPAANASTKEIPKTLATLSALAGEITSDSATFEQFLTETGDAMGAIADHRDQLTQLVSNTRQTTAALGSDTASLTAALDNVPGALQSGSDMFVALRPAIKDLQHLTDVTKPATKDLQRFLRELTPVLQEATPTFGQLRKMFAQPGGANDLLDALRELPTLGRLTDKAFPNAEKALKDSTPVFSFARPYVPDLVSWVKSFGGASATYDANGHYTRAVPVFNAFTYLEDGTGPRLTPRPAGERGTNPTLTSGNLRRCPGAATPAPSDGSAPFVDDGDLAAPDCNAAQRVRATG